MPHDIIDNQTSYLGDAVRPLLEQSQFAHFAVGYFFLSGFKAIAAELEKVQQLRLLIGNTSNQSTIEQLAEAHASREFIAARLKEAEFQNAKQRAELVDEGEERIRERLERLDQTDEDEALAKQLIRLISEHRMRVRIFTRGRLHAKAYIFDYPGGRFEKGIGIVGSSNLSLSGLHDNTELNVVVQGNANHAQLRGWFEQLWQQAEPFDVQLMTQLKSSWAANVELTPFELYLKVLYHLVKDRIDHPLQQMPSDFPPLADFQWAAVQTALRILRRHNGVILGDVVGFGKTLMGTAVLKWLHARERWRALIVSPKPLQTMWEKYNNNFGLRARVLGLGTLRKPDFDLPGWLEDFEPNVVLVDESHNFRHRGTDQYERLAEFLHARGLPCVFLTATPRNRQASDVYNQLHLFHPDESIDLGVSPPNLREYFNKIEKHERELPPLLQHFMVRRTRRHVREHWPDAEINGRKITFPDRKLETIRYNINAAYDGLYDQLRELIEPPDLQKGKTLGLRYARYSLINYIDPALRGQNPYKDLVRAGTRLRGLMRSLLFKRLESSVEAFRLTAAHLVESHKLFLKLLDEQIISAGEDVNLLLKDLQEGDSEDEQLLEALRQASGKYEYSDFNTTKLRADIVSDLACLLQMKRAADPITPDKDAKLQKLLQWIDERSLAGQHKLLIFTQFADTARYLYRHLAPIFKSVEVADSSHNNLDSIVKRFAPIANKVPRGKVADPIAILISTDVLSEGLNLQDAAYIVNYDLHWNPVRLIQRFGRIDRLDTLHKEIHAYNFLPDPKLEQHLGIQATLRERINEIHKSIGEDEPILEPDEKLNEEAMYAIYEGNGKALEAMEEADDSYDSLGVQTAEDIIRKLARDNPMLLAHIKSLPNALRCARRLEWPAPTDSPLAQIDRKPAIFFFAKAGDYQKLYLADAKGEILAEDQMAAVAAIRSVPEERAVTLPAGYNQLVERLRAKFQRAFAEHLAEGGLPHRLSPPQRKAIELIQMLFNETTEEETRKNLSNLREVFRQHLDARAEVELRDWRRTLGDDLATNVDRLRDIAFACKLEDQLVEQAIHKAVEAEAEPLIICTEALV